MNLFSFHQFLYGNDNYGVLMHDPESGQTAAIDAGDARSYLDALSQTGWQLSHILLTHHHWDHTDGVAELAAATGAPVFGPSGDKDGHAHVAQTLSEGEKLRFGGTDIEVIATPGPYAGYGELLPASTKNMLYWRYAIFAGMWADI